MTGTTIIGRPRPHREPSSNIGARDGAGARLRSRWPARWSGLALAVAATVACSPNGASRGPSASQASGPAAAQSTSAAVIVERYGVLTTMRNYGIDRTGTVALKGGHTVEDMRAWERMFEDRLQR